VDLTIIGPEAPLVAGIVDAFAAAGLASVVFDNRNFGASDGEPRQEIDPAKHLFQRDRLGEIIKLVAVRAGEVAAADGNQVRQNRVAL